MLTSTLEQYEAVSLPEDKELSTEVAKGAAATVQADSVRAIPVSEEIDPWLVNTTEADWEVPLTSLVVPEPRSLPVQAELMLVVIPAAELGEDRQVLPPTSLDRISVPLRNELPLPP